MFLAWSEIKRNKLRFSLITGVLMLVAYLVFFLSGLATGLENLNREAVDKWEASGIVLTQESDKNLPQSFMTLDDADKVDASEKAVIAMTNAIATSNDLKANVAIFGINEDEFIMPEPTSGEVFASENEVIAGESLKDDGFEIGDELELSSSEEVLTIVGFTDSARFNAAPVLYTDLKTFNQVKFGEAASENEDQINGVVIKDESVKNTMSDDDFEVLEIEEFITSLPGYTEQSLTLSFMIYFLFIISSVIVAIFLYVLTVQKISMFGVMKAQGISSGYLAKSVVAQTFLLAIIGVVVGFLLTLLTGKFLPAAVPVSFDIPTMLIYGSILIVVAIAGAVFSVWTIVKIDPLKAIGG
ncbi:ABC transporter permease [Paenisporosarcina cavernae]|uniref:Putative hemin transport system permease protein HrtB n=1 Tax=Paenisporosarcina cavernae TaxID=2320858 RepID=A0A385YT22_9BACL|nr:ABC transporter permease [Paenisporosarcina cavernae]AYC29959.1 ABC transporter permease [Paenisporosarcina cavernae]